MQKVGADQDNHTSGVTESLKPKDIEKILLTKTGSRGVGALKIPATCVTTQQKQDFRDGYILRRGAKIASCQAARDEFDLKTPRIEGVSQMLRSALAPTVRDLLTAYKNATKFREKEEAARQRPWHWAKEEKKLEAKQSRAKKIPETPHKLLPTEPIVHTAPQHMATGKVEQQGAVKEPDKLGFPGNDSSPGDKTRARPD